MTRLGFERLASCAAYTPPLLKLGNIKTKKSNGVSMPSIVYRETLHWMTRICVSTYISKQWIQRKRQILTGLWIFDFENASPFLKRITHKQLKHLPQNLRVFFCAGTLLLRQHLQHALPWWPMGKIFQVSSCPDTEEERTWWFRFVGWQLSSCVCPEIAEEFGRIHIADLFVVPSMLACKQIKSPGRTSCLH